VRTEFRDEERPYFLWDEERTVGELRRELASASPERKAQLLGKILREARDPDVWAFTQPEEVRDLFPMIERYLGRRRAFWRYLVAAWYPERRAEG
jgi:hypothetical protein